MSKEYVFEFNGTKEEFIKRLDSYHNSTSYSDKKCYWFDDFIVEIIDNTIRFGVERCGHSGGNWFVPIVTEYNERIEFQGTINYEGPVDVRKKIHKVMDVIEMVLLFILIWPIVVIFWLYQMIKWAVCKIITKPIKKSKTTEEKLFDLMENHLSCVRKEIS